MARLFADENFPHEVVNRLRDCGHDILTIQDIGKASQKVSDAAVMDFAIQDRRAVLTLNRRHFHRLHRTRPEHCGIVSCTDDLDHAALATRIDHAVSQFHELFGRLILVYRPNQQPNSASGSI